MAEKGARAELLPLVRQKYIETGNLTLAAETYGVTRQTATAWKQYEGDEWDKARERKGDHHQRMQLLFTRQMEWIESQLPQQITPGMIDSLSKMGALVEKTEKIVSAARAKALQDATEAIKEATSKAPVGQNFQYDPQTLDYIQTVLYGLRPK